MVENGTNGNNYRKKYSMIGTHVVCDMYNIKKKNLGILTDKNSLESLVKSAIRASGAHLVGIYTPDYFVKLGNGLTTLAAVKESSVDIHTYPEEKGCVLNLYTCGGRAHPINGLKYIKKKLQPETINAIVIRRGNVKNLEIGLPSKQPDKKPFGYSLCIDAYFPYDCTHRKLLDDMDAAYDFLEQLPKILGFKQISTPYLSRKNSGGLIGGIDLVGNSSIDINTRVSKPLLLLDIFSTKKFDLKKLRRKFVKVYKPNDIDEQWIHRGVDYLP